MSFSTGEYRILKIYQLSLLLEDQIPDQVGRRPRPWKVRSAASVLKKKCKCHLVAILLFHSMTALYETKEHTSAENLCLGHSCIVRFLPIAQ